MGAKNVNLTFLFSFLFSFYLFYPIYIFFVVVEPDIFFTLQRYDY